MRGLLSSGAAGYSKIEYVERFSVVICVMEVIGSILPGGDSADLVRRASVAASNVADCPTLSATLHRRKFLGLVDAQPPVSTGAGTK